MDLDERHDEKDFEPTYFQGLEWEPHIVSQLVEFTGLDPEDLESGKFDDDWLLVDDQDRFSEAADCIRNSLWAFNPSFLSGFIPEASAHEDFFSALQLNAEDCNEIIHVLITRLGPKDSEEANFDAFVEEACRIDGYGRFLAPYDGQEQEITDSEGKVSHYLYRIN